MTEEEQVLNVRGEEIIENGDDHGKIKAEHCNGVALTQDGNNGNVGGAVADSSESDLVAENGAASKEEHKVNDEDCTESQVTVSEWEMVNNEDNASSAASSSSAEETCETSNFDVVLRESESERAEVQNGSGSVVVSGDNEDVTDSVVENETSDDVTNSVVDEEVVTDYNRDSENVVVAVQNGVVAEECKSKDGVEVSGDEKDVVAVTVVAEEGVADKSDSEFEVVAVENGVIKSDENDVPVVVEGGAATTDEKDGENDKEDVPVDTKLGECTEKNQVTVDADTASAVSNVKECKSKDDQNGLEKAVVESVSDANVEKSIDGVQNGLLSESVEENKVCVEGEPGKLEVSEDEVIPEDAMESKVEPSVDACETENNTLDNVEGEPTNEAVECATEPSNNAVQSEAESCVDMSEMDNNAGESAAEPSNNVLHSEYERCVDAFEMENSAGKSAAEPSNHTLQSEGEHCVEVSEMKNSAEEIEAEPLNNAVQNNGEVSVDVSNMEHNPVDVEAKSLNNAVQSDSEGEHSADTSDMKTIAVDSEAEPSDNAVEGGREASVDVSETKHIAVEGGREASVDVSETKHIAVEGKHVPSDNALEIDGEPSIDVSEVKNIAIDGEAETSDKAVQREDEPCVDVSETKHIAVEGEHIPSDNAVEIDGKPFIDVSEVKNIAIDGEAETSDKAVQREDEPCVDVSEMKNSTEKSKSEPSNNAVLIETETCVEVSEMKTNVVEGGAEPSVKGESSNHGDEDSEPAQEGSSTDNLDGQNMGTEVVKRPFYFLIRHPRYDDDEKLREKKDNASHLVDEKTEIREAIRTEMQTVKAILREYDQDFKSAKSAERASRDLLKSKRQEMDSVQSTLNRLNNAISVGDINSKIKNIEFMIQHETMLLHEEKELLRQIKQLKQNREELSSNMGKQDQSQSLDDKGSIEEHFKILKKEVEQLRNDVLKTEAATKAARKKYDDENKKLLELQSQFQAADDIRQEAYAKFQALKKQLHAKSKYFWEYKKAAGKAQELAAAGKKEELQAFCVDQVERAMEMWNKNDEFRRDYVRCNTRSTLRRLQTLDGRSLGPDEEPPVIPNALTERPSKNNSLTPQSTLEQEKKSVPTEPLNVKDEPILKVAVQKTEKSQTTKANNKKPAKPASLEKSAVVVSRWGDESDEDAREEPVRTKEEEEQILKAEKAKKEEEAAKLKEKRRLEEIEKAKEALERKKRNAEKAQQRAAIKAQKEAEQKEKEREKRARRKERKKAASTDTAENTEQEPAPSSEPLTRNAGECEQSEKPAEVTKRQQKPSQFIKQTKAKSLPMALRNRAKRRIQPWMWVLIAVLALVALFYLGNNSTLRSSVQGFGF